MREIKFRAFWKEARLMVQVECLRSNGSIEFFVTVTSGAKSCVEFQVLDESEQYALMQYTGLKDKNGVEIYEGDILKDDYYPDNSEHGKEVYVKVSFDNDLLCFKGNIYSDRDGIGCEDIFYIHTDSKRLKVIGNIYENPELL